MKRSLIVATVSIIGALAHLGLAALGAGGPTAFLAHPPFVAVAALTVALAIAGLFSQASLSSGETEDRANRWVLPVLMGLGLAHSYLPAYTDRIGFWTLGGDTLRWIGVTLYAGGGVLRLWPVFALGRRFSGLVAIQEGHELQTAGVFAIIRNPSYLGLLVNALGWGLTFRSGVGVLLMALMVPPLIARIKSEERLLHTHFGGAYEAYRARTWRLLPGLY